MLSAWAPRKWFCLRRLGAALARCTSRTLGQTKDASRRLPRSLQKMVKFWCYFNIDFWSIFDPNLAPQIHQNRSKIDAKMPSHVDLIFWSIFDRFWLPTWTTESWKIEPPLQGEHDFSKNRFSQHASIFDRFWCQHGSILAPKILQNPHKNRSQEASIF